MSMRKRCTNSEERKGCKGKQQSLASLGSPARLFSVLRGRTRQDQVGESRGESLTYSQGINPYGNQSWLTLRSRSPYAEAPCGRAGLVAADSQLCPWYPVSWACQWEQWNPLVSFRVPERTQVVCSPLTDSSWGATEMGDRGTWGGGGPVVFKDRCCFCQRSLCSLLYPGDRTREVLHSVRSSSHSGSARVRKANGPCCFQQLENV